MDSIGAVWYRKVTEIMMVEGCDRNGLRGANGWACLREQPA
jgi:hypothetical protein